MSNDLPYAVVRTSTLEIIRSGVRHRDAVINDWKNRARYEERRADFWHLVASILSALLIGAILVWTVSTAADWEAEIERSENVISGPMTSSPLPQARPAQ